MEENKTPVCVHVTDEAIITLTAEEYRKLADKAVRFDILYADTKGNIDAGEASYNRINSSLVLHALGLANYHPPKVEEEEN